VAHELDKSCSPALIHLANYHFSLWKKLGECRFENDIMIRVDKAQVGGLQVGDKLQFSNSETGAGEQNFVKEISNMRDAVMVTLAERVSANRVGESAQVRYKEYGRVLALALNASKSTSIKQVQAESYYIQGRVFHDRGHTDKAAQMYGEALKKWDGMDLAAFALGKIELSKGGFNEAMAHFKAVAKRTPEDRDTQAYLCLVRALHKNEISSYEKIKDVAVGFEYDVDLWLANGQLRQKLPEEFGVALKCYLAALDLLKQRPTCSNSKVSLVLNNIAMLQLHMGRIQPALESIKSSLIYVQSDPPAAQGDQRFNPAFSHGEFDKVFYSWAEMPATSVKKGADDFFAFTDSSGASLNLDAGDEVLIDDVVHVVQSVKPTGVVAYSPVDVSLVGASKQALLPLRQKMLGHNFNNDTTTICFNFARILEEAGRLDAASELYLALLKRNPAFMDAYLRMSCINMNIGKFDAAMKWVLRALSVDNRDQDALAAKADIHYRLRQFDMVGNICDDMFKNDKNEKKDPRPMLLLGNMHFQRINSGRPADEDSLKTSEKFIRATLQKDHRNVYAANGIGMLCAEQDELDAASEIFLRAKEFSTGFSDDIDSNLAHTRMIQGRTAEAEHLYQLNMRSVTKSSRTPEPGRVSSMCEAMAYAQFKQKRFEDAIRSLLRGIHHDPRSRANVERHWYNIAVVRQDQATAKMHKVGKKTVRAVQDARDEFKMAFNLFTHLSIGDGRKEGKILMDYSRDTAESLAVISGKWVQKCEVAMKDAERDEQAILQDRERRNAEHQVRLRAQEAERMAAQEAALEAKREIQRLAAQKQQRLDELKAGWTAAPVAESKAKDKKGKKGTGGSKGGYDDDMGGGGSAAYTHGVYESDSDDGLGGGLLSKKPEEKDPFAEDSDEDDEIFGSKRKVEAPVGEEDGDGKRLKKSGVVDNDSDDDALFGNDAPAPAAGRPEVDDLFNSDED